MEQRAIREIYKQPVSNGTRQKKSVENSTLGSDPPPPLFLTLHYLTCDTRKQKILDRLLILGPGEGFEAVEGVEVEEVGHGHAEEGGLAPAEQRGPALVPG